MARCSAFFVIKRCLIGVEKKYMADMLGFVKGEQH